MIIEATGNLIEQEVDALVNTVNTVGVMGKGVALQFKRAFPDNFKHYKQACNKGDVALGTMFVTYTGKFAPRIIINFPTKQHWKSHANLDEIRIGLTDLRKVILNEKITSIALPPLGCGNGGLNWNDVKPLIYSTLADIPDLEVRLYSPWSGTPSTTPIVVGTKPQLTDWRASLIALLYQYSVLAYDATHLEAQKLLYFLKEVGDPIQAKFVKGNYGPYDEGMKHGLQALEGHYLTGFGEGRVMDSMQLVPGAYEEASVYLANHADRIERIKKVGDLIEGFESPYGLELLATVHWIATRDDKDAKNDSNLAIKLAHDWSERKRKTLRDNHIQIAWQRLNEFHWLTAE